MVAVAPDAGDIVWIDFTPQSGREQAGKRPALVLSPRAYNDKVGLMIVCPNHFESERLRIRSSASSRARR